MCWWEAGPSPEPCFTGPGSRSPCWIAAASFALADNNFAGVAIFATPVQPGYNSCGTSAINPDTPCPALTQFAPSTSNPTAFGNQTRNQYRGPGYFNTDMSVMKNFKIPRWEAARFGVGFQFFNLFNHPNFDKPINDIAQGPGVFGTIVSKRYPRRPAFSELL